VDQVNINSSWAQHRQGEQRAIGESEAPRHWSNQQPQGCLSLVEGGG